MTEFEIKPHKKISFGFKELWSYNELIYFFTWRDIMVKYKQTLLGFLWAILQPLFMTIVFTFFLGNAITTQTKMAVEYPVFVFSGMLIWGLFSSGLSNASSSMVNNANIIKKIYFPRLIIPISAVLASLVDFFVSFLLFIGVIVYFRVGINWLHFFLYSACCGNCYIFCIGNGYVFSGIKHQIQRCTLCFTFLYSSIVVCFSHNVPSQYYQQQVGAYCIAVESDSWSFGISTLSFCKLYCKHGCNYL